jgi:ribosomal protein S18 acetylase RimI-like enzyme
MRSEADAVMRLLRTGVYTHVHIDWTLPGEWLGTPGFVVYDREWDGVDGRGKHRRSADISACLAIGADPLPAAWVRVAAVDTNTGFNEVQAMFAEILERLDPAITEISWFLTAYWPLRWLQQLGFQPTNEVVAYTKPDLTIPSYNSPVGLQIRPVLLEEMPLLAAIEEAAFEPRWRHSLEGLVRAWRQSISFDVALLDGEPVAFQFSSGGEDNAHLSRMTVHPEHQGKGIGAALLARAIEGYRLQNIHTASLNTQADNTASQRLYERFGFQPTGYTYPVWSYFLSDDTEQRRKE